MRLLTFAVDTMGKDDDANEVAVHIKDLIRRARFPIMNVNSTMAGLVYAIGIKNVSTIETLGRVS